MSVILNILPWLLSANPNSLFKRDNFYLKGTVLDSFD